MRIEPMRDVVVVKLRAARGWQGKIEVVGGPQAAVREAEVVSVGPEVRDIAVGDVVLVNLLVTSKVADSYLVAEENILGMLC